MSKLSLFSFAALVGLLATGCSNSNLPDNAQPVFKVSGTLTYKGAPMNGAVITFHPASSATATDPKSKSPSSTATADDQGKYSLNTYNTGDGAPEGQYTVTIYWPGESKVKMPPGMENDQPLGPDKLKNAYADPKTTKLKATVEKKENTTDFTLP